MTSAEFFFFFFSDERVHAWNTRMVIHDIVGQTLNLNPRNSNHWAVICDDFVFRKANPQPPAFSQARSSSASRQMHGRASPPEQPWRRAAFNMVHLELLEVDGGGDKISGFGDGVQVLALNRVRIPGDRTSLDPHFRDPGAHGHDRGASRPGDFSLE